MCDPYSMSQLCDDASDVALDLTGFFGGATSVYMGVFSRAVSLASNLLPHHTCHPEHVVCQSVLLLLSLNDLMKAKKYLP